MDHPFNNKKICRNDVVIVYCAVLFYPFFYINKIGLKYLSFNKTVYVLIIIFQITSLRLCIFDLFFFEFPP